MIMSLRPNEPPSHQASDREILIQMISGSLVAQLVHVAARLGIADLLADGAKSSEELASRVGAHPRSLYRALRALASLGLFAETPDGRFELTPLALPLQAGAPESLRALAIAWGDTFWPCYGELLHSVSTGDVAFQHVHGMGVFAYLQQHPRAGEVFNEAMTNLTRPHAAAVLAAYDFADITTLADIGGGNGSLIAAILAAYPRMRGIIFDQQTVLDSARRTLEREGILPRCTLTAGDFFQSVPQGCDAYVLKDIIHDWEDERAVVILENCRQAMRAGGKLLLVERAVPTGNAPAAGKLIDVAMLAITGGCERTEAEYRDLLARAGLHLTQVVPTPSEMVVVEAIPAGSEAHRRQTWGD
jgi:precorrin-6B methylase 2